MYIRIFSLIKIFKDISPSNSLSQNYFSNIVSCTGIANKYYVAVSKERCKDEHQRVMNATAENVKTDFVKQFIWQQKFIVNNKKIEINLKGLFRTKEPSMKFQMGQVLVFIVLKIIFLQR